MNRGYILESIHPACLFVYFALVVVLGICIPLPSFLIAGLVVAAVTDLVLRGSASFKLIGSLAALIVVMSLISPLFNPQGDTVIFTYFGERPYSLDAIVYGASVACMFASMILWFAAAAHVLDTNKMMYLFGDIFPKLGLVVASSMMLLKRLSHRLAELRSVRKLNAEGRSVVSEEKGAKVGLIAKVNDAGSVLADCVQWAFAEGIDRADAMRSRGFATGKRSSFRRYRIGAKDVAFISVAVILAAVVVSCCVVSGAQVIYFPEISVPSLGAVAVLGLIAYACLLCMPLLFVVWGWMHWRFCKFAI